MKGISDILLDRRATSSFEPAEVPEEVLESIMRLTLQSPSGYNIQPWRFVVVKEPASKLKLQEAAFNQPKVSEASVVIIVVGLKEAWKESLDEVLHEGIRRGAGKEADYEKTKKGAVNFLSNMPMETWVNRHSMIAFTTMMLLAEAYGFDTAPMEGFDGQQVKSAFNIPDDGEVVGLLAIGRKKGPDKAFPGRYSLNQLVFREEYGRVWRDDNIKKSSFD